MNLHARIRKWLLKPDSPPASTDWHLFIQTLNRIRAREPAPGQAPTDLAQGEQSRANGQTPAPGEVQKGPQEPRRVLDGAL